MKRLLLVITLIAATLAPTARPASVTCQVRVHKGKRICWCYDGRWVTAPMLLCKLTGK